jgi:SOS response regulatory protein OraA/RecX
MERLRRSEALEAEVRAGLERNGFQAPTVERVVALLRERRLLNDTKTINSLVEAKSGKRAAGIEKLRFELTRKGAPEELIESRLAEITPDEQAESIRSLLRAKCKPTDSRAKVARLLLSRGFDEDSVCEAVNEFFGKEEFPG